MVHMMTMEEVRTRSLDDLLREVARTRDTFTVVLPEGETVEIRPSAILKPLQRLPGYVPAGWKEALYGE